MNTKLLPVFCVGLLASLALSCDRGAAETSGDGGKMRVVATTTMIGDLVARIGGDRVDLKVIMGAGVDPHTFKPSPSDFAELARAKVCFYNGLHLEGKMVETFEAKLKEKSVAVAETIPTDELRPWQEGEGGAHDPHVWFNVQLWSAAASAVRAGLAEHDPAHADEYHERAEALHASLRALHEE